MFVFLDDYCFQSPSVVEEKVNSAQSLIQGLITNLITTNKWPCLLHQKLKKNELDNYFSISYLKVSEDTEVVVKKEIK